MFADLLDPVDAARATNVVDEIRRHGLRCALTGGLAVEAHLRARGQLTERRRLNDIDFVVAGFDAIPESLSRSFLQYHVHPDATDGKTLLQLIDQERRIRVDLFAALGKSLSRARPLASQTGEVNVLSIEDLVARTTALVCGRVTRRRVIDVKHVVALMRLRGFGDPPTLAKAWSDHRQQVSGSLEEASQEAVHMLNSHPELVIVDQHLNTAHCERCRPHRGFRPAAPAKVIEILGYC